MYTNATVKKLNNDGTVLLVCPDQECSSCKASFFCNNKNFNEFCARNDKNLALSEGQKVEIFLPPVKTVGSTVLVFGLPLVFFAAGYLAVKNLTSLNEGLCALCALGMSALSFGLSAYIGFKNRHSLMPVISSVIQDSK